MLSKTLKIDPYPVDIKVVLSDIEEAAKKYNVVLSNGNDITSDLRAAFTFMEDDTIYVVFSNSDDIDIDDILVHELIHVKNLLFDHIGHKLDTQNDELEAYRVQSLYTKIKKIIVYLENKMIEEWMPT